jgi:hypothetical protein
MIISMNNKEIIQHIIIAIIMTDTNDDISRG